MAGKLEKGYAEVKTGVLECDLRSGYVVKLRSSVAALRHFPYNP